MELAAPRPPFAICLLVEFVFVFFVVLCSGGFLWLEGGGGFFCFGYLGVVFFFFGFFFCVFFFFFVVLFFFWVVGGVFFGCSWGGGCYLFFWGVLGVCGLLGGGVGWVFGGVGRP